MNRTYIWTIKHFKEDKKMHRKKKIPVSFIAAFVVSLALAIAIAVLIPTIAPAATRFQGMIFFGSWLILCFISVGIVGLVTKKNR